MSHRTTNKNRLRVAASLLGVGLTSFILINALTADHVQAAAGVAVLPDGRIAIDSLPYVIDDCGSYVVRGCLSGDENFNGITIASDDVSLDLNGNTLTGISGTLNGIVIQSGVRNVRIVNGSLRDWGANGVEGTLASEITLENINAIGNAVSGLSVGAGSSVRHCRAMENGATGIVAGPSTTVEDCSAVENLNHGILAGAGSIVTRSLADRNSANGIDVTGTLSTSSSRDNGHIGILVEDGGAYHCAALGNASTGIRVGNRSLAKGCSVSTGDGSRSSAPAYEVASHSVVRESRGEVDGAQFAVRMTGQRSYVNDCGFTTKGAQSSIDWAGQRNFVGNCLHSGFLDGWISNPTPNAWGQGDDINSGVPSNFDAWHNLLMSP